MYCSIQRGQFGTALRQCRVLNALANRLGDATLRRMVASARRWCRSTHALWAAGIIEGPTPPPPRRASSDAAPREDASAVSASLS
ncbi:hypothetical protein EON67_04970, partial [archaeon]